MRQPSIFCVIICILFSLLCSTTIAKSENLPDTAQIVVINKFNIPQLKRQRTIRIFLPAEYNISNKRYPVIYMQDGQKLFSENNADTSNWGIDVFLKQLPAKNQCIIVAVNNSPKYRMGEYNPYDSYYSKGDGIAYVKFLAETLKPYIDNNYRTKKDAKYTAIAGSSLGGLTSFYAELKYPDVFGSAGIFSPAFFMAAQAYNDVENTPVSKKSRFYFICGDKEEIVKESIDVNRMDSIARKKGLSEKQSALIIIKGAKHNEQQWRGDFPLFYKWLIKKF